MSSIARMFIALNALLAALCVGWAVSHLGTVDNFKAQLATKEAELDAATTANEEAVSKLNTAIRDLENSRSGIRSEMERLEVENNSNSTQLQEQKSLVATLTADLGRISTELGGYADASKDAMAKYEAAVAAKEAADEARRNAEAGQESAVEAQEAAERALAEAQTEIQNLTMARTSLAKDLENANTLIDIARQAGFDTEVGGAPPINGAVTAVDTSMSPGLIAINKGEDAQVKRGMTFNVFSGNQFKGKVRVETVGPNMCTASIVTTYEGRQISVGDQAATQI